MRRIPLAVLALTLAACAPAKVQPVTVVDRSVQPVPVLAGCNGEAPIRVGGAIAPPQRTHNVQPEYPADAIAASVAGVVVAEITIGCGGEVASAAVLKGVPALNDAATAAIKQWRYRPTLLNGTPVPVIMTVTVTFTPEGI